MITGFNTDINYQGVTYHVQTEDKGTATPLILSLVYNGGTILASKRSPYDDLLLEDFDEKVLAERLHRQHKLICAAISSGRIEDLKRMSMKPSAKKQAGAVVEKIEEVNIKIEKSEKVESPKPTSPPKIEIPAKAMVIEKTKPQKPATTELPDPGLPQPPIFNQSSIANEDLPREKTTVDLEQILNEERIEAERRTKSAKSETRVLKPEQPRNEEIIVEAFEIIEDVEIIDAGAVEIIEDKSTSQTFLEELSRAKSASASDSASGELMIILLGGDDFYSGDEKTIEIAVFRGTENNVLDGAHIMVKILGSAFTPLLYHAKTDSNGMAKVHLKLPVFSGGRAIVLVKAMSDGDEAEFRRVIKTR